MSEDDEKIRLERKLESFFHGLNAGLKVLSEVREVYDESMAFEFNSLNFLVPNENKISEIIAFFLDPDEVHGQKDNFLKIFLNTVLSNPTQTEILLSKEIIVNTQYYTSNGRPIDIVIQFGNNDFLIGIENKVWGACDQVRQIYDYAADLKEKSNGKFLLLYSSRNGEPPCNESITEDEIEELGEYFKILRFNSKDAKDSIITLFREFEMVCMADNVRAFIKDFIKYLNTQFNVGESIMGETDFITDFMSKDENMALALKMIYNGSERSIKEKLLGKITIDIKNFSDEHKLVCIVEKNMAELQSTYSRVFSFRKNGWEKTTEIAVWFESQNMKNCYYGICHASDKLLREIYLNLNPALGFEEPVLSDAPQDWTSNCTAYYNKYLDWNDSQPWLDMITLDKDGKSKFLADLFEKLLTVLNCAEQIDQKTGIRL